MKGPAGKTFEGIYCNPRFIHAAASLVGCVVHIQVKNGSIYEGVFRTFSHRVDFVLEMVHKVDTKSLPAGGISNETKIIQEEVTDKMIFRVEDVVMLSAANVDLEFATRDSFTDTAISKFNGQVLERELEPWDGGATPNESLTELGNEAEVSNGWNADEMFKTNETKYGVKSSFDSNLLDYTIPLNKQNTEEYKLQEAKASKIAHEIESGFHYRNNLTLENGDEEEQFSAVSRTADASTPPAAISTPVASNNNNSLSTNNNGNRYVNHRMRKMPGIRPPRSSPSPTVHPGANRMPHAHSQTYHKVSSPNSYPTNAQGRMVSAKSFSGGIPTPSPRYANNPSPLPPRQNSVSPPQANVPSQTLANQQYPPLLNRMSVSNSSSPPNSNCQFPEDCKMNGDIDKKNGKYASDYRTAKASNKETSGNTDFHKDVERYKDTTDKKGTMKKVYDEKTEDLKRFGEKFKLPDAKETNEKESQGQKKSPILETEHAATDSKQSLELKPGKVDHKSQPPHPTADSPDSTKSSPLNPNAKEFILNPNAKSFTPGAGARQNPNKVPFPLLPNQKVVISHRRGMPSPSNMIPPPVPPLPTVQQHPPRLQSPVIAMPQPHLMQHVFTNVTPHYVLQTNTMPLASPYTPATSVAQAPRYSRKAMPMALPRNDSSQSIHVQAATGQPILAPPTLSTPQYTIQYASPGMIHPPGPPQPQITYAPMYSMVGPRVISPQPVGMLSAGSYGENPHVPTHYIMNPSAVAAVQHSGASNSNQQHSNPSTPQSQTPNLHPAPSPVHQSMQNNQHGQPPTPTGHPSNPPTPQLVFQSQISAQHPLHINAASTNPGYPSAMYGAGPQPIMLLPQHALPGAPHPATFTALQNHFHAQAAHSGTPTQIIQHPSVAMIQTSIAHAQVAASNSHYVSHSQV